MDVNDVFELIRFSANATINGDVSPSEFNRVIALAEHHFVNSLLGVPEQYLYDKPIPRIQYSMNRTIRQKLSPLIEEIETLYVDSNGRADYPSRYLMLDAMYTTNMSNVRFAAQEKLASFIRSKIDPVATNPIYLIDRSGFQFYPINIGPVKISYVRAPSPMVYATSNDTNGRPVYNENNSIQPQWADTDLFGIISRSLQLVGVNLQLPVLYQYAEQIKKEG